MLLTFNFISISALALKPALQSRLYEKVLLLPLEFVFDIYTSRFFIGLSYSASVAVSFDYSIPSQQLHLQS